MIGGGSDSDRAVCSGAADDDVAVRHERLIRGRRRQREIRGWRFRVTNREGEISCGAVFVNRLIGDRCDGRGVVA